MRSWPPTQAFVPDILWCGLFDAAPRPPLSGASASLKKAIIEICGGGLRIRIA